jgi:hypothetical protein
VAVKPAENKGICKLVAPSVVATITSTNMQYPLSLTHANATECVYRPKLSSSTAIVLRYDTDVNASTFSLDKSTFEHQGQKLGPIVGLADEAYYFIDASAANAVTTLVLRQNSLQLLVAGSATLQQLESIAHYAITQFESAHPAVGPTAPS